MRRFTYVDAKDDAPSLRRALEAYARDAAAWGGVLAAQERLEAVKAKLLAAGYAREDLVKLTLDNS